MNSKVAGILREQFPGSVCTLTEESVGAEQPVLFIPLKPDQWLEIANFLRDDPDLKFDSLQCITGVDLGVDQPLDVRYNLHSMTHRHKIEICIQVDKNSPRIPSVEQVWRIGDWFEREVYDMFGVEFIEHRDLRRMLLPDDWEGWPLRKDYETPATYHGIVIPKVKEGWE